MKKVLFFAVFAILAFLSSCSNNGYDQKEVDRLCKISTEGQLTEDDYKSMVNQLSYLIDEVEGVKDIEKWGEENPKKVGAMGMMAALEMCSEMDSNFPEDLKKDVKKLNKRFEAMTEKFNDVSDEEGILDE